MANRSNGESVLQKHLRVLDAFDALHPRLRLTEIERRTGLAHATASRLVRELERSVLLERLSDGSFRLGMRLWEYASRTPGGLGLRELARPWMNALQGRVRQHVQLGVISGCDVLFIDRISAPDAVVNATLIGGRLPIALSSSGVVLIAHSSEQVMRTVIDAGWEPMTRFSFRDGEQLRQAAVRSRREGYAVLDGHIYEESRGIAVPVLGAEGTAHAALSVIVPNDAASPWPIIELLKVAAVGIARAIDQAQLFGGESGDAEGPALGPLVSTSQATLDYFSSI